MKMRINCGPLEACNERIYQVPARLPRLHDYPVLESLHEDEQVVIIRNVEISNE